MNILAITQARFGSTRLPAKILKKVGNKTLLEIHIERILKSKHITQLIVATTNEKGSEEIISIANKCKVESFKGDINDVLKRFYNAAKPQSPDYVVRLTSDCPLIDSKVIDNVIETCLANNSDYVSNTLKPTYPDGVDVEVFKFKTLEIAHNNATLKSDREHVTPYIWRNSSFKGGDIFTSINVENDVDCSKYRITVDTSDDFLVIKALIEGIGEDKPWSDYIKFLDDNEHIKAINHHHTRNEGYQKSLLNDKI